MTLPIYFNLGGELVYPVGEAHATTLFSAGMNVFGLLVIESIKLIDSKASSRGSDGTINNGLLWTGIFQGGLLLLGLIFLIGRVHRFSTSSDHCLEYSIDYVLFLNQKIQVYRSLTRSSY